MKSNNNLRPYISSTGSYLPENIVSNDDLSKKVDTSDEWIFTRTGIKKRHIAAEGELTSDLAQKACEDLFKNSKLQPEDIELIIIATTSPDLTFPSTATILQQKINANNAFAFDVQAVCSGFVYALSVADSYITSGKVKNVLVVGAETLSRIVDWKDRNTCVLFGDGAGAVLLEATCENDRGILSSKLKSDGQLVDILKTNGGPSLSQSAGHIEMAGREVFKHAVSKMSEVVLESLEMADVEIADIDLLIPHQANIRILESVAKKLNLREDQVVKTVADHANTSAASIPLALDVAVKNNRLNKGDLVVLEALGGGLTWGSIVLKW